MQGWRYRELAVSALFAALGFSQFLTAGDSEPVQMTMFRIGLGLIALSFAVRPGLFFRRLTLRAFLFDGSAAAILAWLLSICGNLCLVAAAVAAGFGMFTAQPL